MTIAEIKAKGWLLFECISGSRAYGLHTPTSDTDLKGVYYVPREQFYGFDYPRQLSNETNDEVYYELGRFVELLLKNNPNMLELLATPEDCVLYRHPVMEQLHISMFLSKLCKDTFAGYAITQIRKARGYKKKIVNPVAPERKTVPDCCFILEGAGAIPLREWLQDRGYREEHCGLSSVAHTKGLYALFYNENGTYSYKGIVNDSSADDVALSSIPKGETMRAYLYFNLEGYSAYCKEYREYWSWVEKRNEQRYQGNMQHGKGYDAKNLMHTIRLLQMALEIATTGQLQVRRINREALLAIKTGDLEYDALLQMANTLMDQAAAAYDNSNLPQAPDKEKITAILVNMRNALYNHL
jgi:hypothetical protein